MKDRELRKRLSDLDIIEIGERTGRIYNGDKINAINRNTCRIESLSRNMDHLSESIIDLSFEVAALAKALGMQYIPETHTTEPPKYVKIEDNKE